jgi:hypothetical protein
MRVIERIAEHYDVQEMPFGRDYRWSPECVVVECECGKKTIFKWSSLISSVAICQCGEDHAVDVEEEVVAHMMLGEDWELAHHPWLYDARAQDKQHSRDEVAYPEDSAWRYNDVTARNGIEE